MFGALLHERLVDELFLTLAPKLTGGGESPTISTGPELMELVPLELRLGARARRRPVPPIRDRRGRPGDRSQDVSLAEQARMRQWLI